MATFGLLEYQDAGPEVRAVYDDIMATRQTDWINNFWKAIAHDPATLRRTWESVPLPASELGDGPYRRIRTISGIRAQLFFLGPGGPRRSAVWRAGPVSAV